MTSIARVAMLAAMAIVLGSCSGITESEPADEQISAVSTEKGASVQKNDVSINKQPFSFTVRNSCTGGIIRVSGTRHITVHTKVRGDGTREDRYSINQVGHGTDAAGTKYVYKVNILETSYIGDPEECPFTFIEVRRIRLIAPGAGNNLTAIVRFEVTTECDGSFDVRYNVDEVTCK